MITNVSTTATSNQTVSQSSSSQSGVLNSDFETFLKMLTTQAQNQDPLNPLDSTEYASQLASFSSVEQQVMTNDLLTALNAQFQSSGLGQLVDWVDSEVLQSGSAYFDGRPIALQVPSQPNADSATVVISDANGNEVAHRQLSLGDSFYEWDGLGNNSETLSSGFYTFRIDAYASGELINSGQATTYQRVTEARSGSDGEIVLTLLGGAEVNASGVDGIRVTD